MGHLKEDLSNFANLLGNTQQGDFYRAKADSAKEVVSLMDANNFDNIPKESEY